LGWINEFYFCFFTVFIFLIITQLALAKEFPVTARLFAGTTEISPKDLNTEMASEGLKEFDNITQFSAQKWVCAAGKNCVCK